MPGARFEHDFTDEAGNLLVGNITVQVARENGGPVQCYSDRELTTGLGSTFVNDGGKVAFFAAGGALRVTVTQGLFSRTLHYYALGLAGETDFTFAQNAGVWSSLTTYARGEYVVRNGVGIFISAVDGNLNHTPDSTTPGSTAYWTYYPGLTGPPGKAGSGMMVAISDEVTSISTGTNKLRFRAPNTMVLTEIKASLGTASSSGLVTVDVNVNGSSILSTKLSIDQGETTSRTAATPAVISTPLIADDDEIAIDIDAAGTGAAGLKLTFIAQQT